MVEDAGPAEQGGEELGDRRELVEGVDYYVEVVEVEQPGMGEVRREERWVFTGEFLRRRGWCCGSGCRHCPYGEGGDKSGGSG